MSGQGSSDDRLRGLAGMSLLVTGGLGFIGRAVVEAAQSRGARVTVLDRRPAAADDPHVEVVQGDVVGYPPLPGLIERSAAVVHLAGTLGTESTFADLEDTVTNNVTATARVIASCLRVGRRAVYLTVGNDWLNPYTITRRCAADLGLMANAECGGDFRVLRVMNAYGPGQRFTSSVKVVPSFVRQCMLNEPISVYGDGNQCVDLVHVHDVAAAILHAILLDDLPLDRCLEVGTGVPHRVLEVAYAVRAVSGATSAIEFVGRRRGEPLHSVTLARDDTLAQASGLGPWITMEEGIADAYAWYVANPSYLGLPDRRDPP
jgi:UDP-glucose 4-epimerase